MSKVAPPLSTFTTFIAPQPTSHLLATRSTDCWFVDKTMFLELFESDLLPDFVIFRRPPRFGRSTWLKTLEFYYDISVSEEEFQYYFKNMKIEAPPKQKYFIWYLDFNLVLQGMRFLISTFHIILGFNTPSMIESSIRQSLQYFIDKYKMFLKPYCNTTSLPMADIMTTVNVIIKVCI
jgi:hypothetical protein